MMKKGINIFFDLRQESGWGQTRLLIDGVEKGVSDHNSPTLTPLVQWQSPQFTPGRHEFVMEVLKESIPASKGNLVRLRELRLHSLPVLDAHMLRLAVASDNPQCPVAAIHRQRCTRSKN